MHVIENHELGKTSHIESMIIVFLKVWEGHDEHSETTLLVREVLKKPSRVLSPDLSFGKKRKQIYI
jgi:hypothetical protein